jgi:hypothetical protein
MGLGAVVYKRVQDFPLTQRNSIRLVDQETGEIESDDKIDPLTAAEIRFGNISQVAHLRALLEKLLPAENRIILHKVLYDGSHSGDFIPVSALPEIETEINLLRQQQQAAADLSNFLDQLTHLAEIARRSSNPIVFV